MKPLSMDLRVRIVEARKQGATVVDVARRFAVSERSVIRLCQQERSTGQLAPKQIGGYRKSCLEDHDDILCQWITEDPGLTLEQLMGRLEEKLGIIIGQTALWSRLNLLGLSYKKNFSRRRAGST